MLEDVSVYTVHSHSWRELDPVFKMPILCFLRDKKNREANLEFEVRIPALSSDTPAKPLQVFQMLSVKFSFFPS